MNKHTIDFTDPDRANAILSNLINHYMRSKHADVVDQMKQYIENQFKSSTDELSTD